MSDLRYGKLASFISRIGVRVPYAIEGGPTFLSTNSRATFDELSGIKEKLVS